MCSLLGCYECSKIPTNLLLVDNLMFKIFMSLIGYVNQKHSFSDGGFEL